MGTRTQHAESHAQAEITSGGMQGWRGRGEPLSLPHVGPGGKVSGHKHSEPPWVGRRLPAAGRGSMLTTSSYHSLPCIADAGLRGGGGGHSMVSISQS